MLIIKVEGIFNVEKRLWKLEFAQFQDYAVNSLNTKLSFLYYVLFTNEFELILNPEGENFSTQKPPPDKMKITNRNFTKKENILQLHHTTN